MFYQEFFHPICGKLYIAGDEYELKGIFFSEEGMKDKFSKDSWIDESTGPIAEAIEQISLYLQRERKEFTLSPLHPEGTLFQRKIWGELKKIPYGEVITYGELAERTGHPKAVRAAGQACKANPFPLLIPCHRVIGKSGKMTGYAGSLIDLKERLIQLEKESVEK